jgi:hypothetical protein
MKCARTRREPLVPVEPRHTPTAAGGECSFAGGSAPHVWTITRMALAGSACPSGRAASSSRKLITEEMVITAFAGTRLRHELDRVPLWQGDDIGVRALWELFSQYTYLPRLRESSVSLGAPESRVASLTWNPDAFA